MGHKCTHLFNIQFTLGWKILFSRILRAHLRVCGMLGYHACGFHPLHHSSLPWDWEAGRTLKGPALICGVCSSVVTAGLHCGTHCFVLLSLEFSDRFARAIDDTIILAYYSPHSGGSVSMEAHPCHWEMSSYYFFLFYYLIFSVLSESLITQYLCFICMTCFSLFYYPVYLFILILPAMSSTWLSNLLF